MLSRVIKSIFFLPLALSINSINVLSSETKNYIDNVLDEKANITFVDYQEIEEIILIKNFNDSSLCKAIILPGVGAFDPAMNNLINTDLITDLKDWIKSGKSFLGICLGLQLLFESSDEGKVQGLGILKGKIQKIPNIVNQRIPHMGWCQLLPTIPNTLLELEELNNWVYFVHSYHAIPDDLILLQLRLIMALKN